MRRSGLYQQWFKDAQSRASDNVWYTFERIEYSFSLLCSGIELRNPTMHINNHTFEIRTQVKSGRPVNIDFYCDNVGQELVDLHPIQILKHPESSQKIENGLKKFKDIEHMKNYSHIGPLMGHRSLWKDIAWWPDRHMDLNFISPFVHQIVYHYAYEQSCRENHPEYADVFKCAREYSFLKKHDDYDRIMDFDRSYFGHHSKYWTEQPLWILRDIAKHILYIGLFLHMLKIRIPQTTMISIMCIGNVILMIPSLWMPFRRFGPDYTAYLSQASQFWAGQTNQMQISSVQGPSFYPAGHLLHYVPVYWLYLYTDQAEYIWKFTHFLIHSTIQFLVARIAYSYYRKNPMKAQMICFMLLGNEEIREFNQYLFNDSLLALHMMLSLYFIIVKNKPVLASFFLTLSMSIKAGAILMIPTFLGWIMYLHGTIVLIKSLLLIVMFQLLIMAPMCFDPIAKIFGFPAGMTFYMDYLKYSKFIEDKERKYGAT